MNQRDTTTTKNCGTTLPYPHPVCLPRKPLSAPRHRILSHIPKTNTNAAMAIMAIMKIIIKMIKSCYNGNNGNNGKNGKNGVFILNHF